MAHDIFLSYSSHDKAIADAVCATVEAHRIRCWIAPRDIMPGTPYGEALVDAIDGSRLLVLVFSSGANNSSQVMREVERAASRGIAILPFRIENVLPSKAMQFFLPSIHWLDALTPPLEKHLHALADTARLLLDRIDRNSPSVKTKNTGLPLEQATPFHQMSALRNREVGAQGDLKFIKDAPTTPAPSHHSRYYVERPVDQQLQAAIARQDSMIRIRGAHQVGKTSLLARGLEQARASGSRVVVTDFQRLSTADLESAEALFRTLGEWIADELKLAFDFDGFWNSRRNPGRKFNQIICQEVLGRINEPLVWAMDEMDCLFPYPYRSEVFSLFRSWHNARATEPTRPWRRLTLVCTYATEAHLLIDNLDLNQAKSPGFVG